MNKESTLTSLAMLKVNIDSGKDYLEYLRPFVLQVLAYDDIEIITSASVGNKLKESCGLFIPNRTTELVLKRLARSRYIKKENGVFVIVKDIDVEDFSSKKATASRNISAVTNALIDFAKQVLNKDISEKEAVDALITFLSKFSIHCLKSYLRGTALPDIKEHDDWKIVLVSKYLRKIDQSDQVRFDSFLILLQGHMLANALLCPDLHSVAKSYKDVVFYFDTPLLVQFLELEGKAKKQAINELINLVQRLDGRISVLSHSIDELHSVIEGASNHIDSPKGHGFIVYEARRSGRTKSDMILIANQAEDIIESAGITITPTPDYNIKLQIDETAFGDVLSEEVSYYYNPRAIEYDINSLRSIYVLRGGTCPRMVEKSKAVFVTNNWAFSKAAFDYGKNIEQSREVSAVITDFSLANTAWLKAPQGAPLLPQKEVMAFAYAALTPSKDFLHKVINEAEKLKTQGKISARDHQLLRSNIHVQDELMSLTLGEDEELTEKSITETIHKITEEIKAEGRATLTAEQAAHTQTQEKLAMKSDENLKIRQRLYWRCEVLAKLVSKIIFYTLSVLVIIGIIAGIYTHPVNPVIDWVLIAGFVVLILLTIFNLFIGVTVSSIQNSIKEKLRNWLFIHEAKTLGISTNIDIKNVNQDD